MTPRFHHVALIGKYQPTVPGTTVCHSRAIMQNIAQFLERQGCQVSLEAETASNTGLSHYDTIDADAIGLQCDLGLVVGGDGTMLGIGRRLARYGTPLIGINQGRLGFITDIALADYPAILPAMLQGEYEEDQRPLMHASVMRDGECVFEALAMNDVVVARGATAAMVELRVEVDGHFVATQRADGMIISSPTGSTAYSMSAGGPILNPTLTGIALVPLCPHALSNRPIIVNDNTDIELRIVYADDPRVHFDGQVTLDLQAGDSVRLRRSEHKICFLHPPGYSYFAMLRQKLQWSERPKGP